MWVVCSQGSWEQFTSFGLTLSFAQLYHLSDSLWGFFNSMAGNHVYLLPESSTNICLKYWKAHIFQWMWEVELAKPFTWFRSSCPISRRDSSMAKRKPCESLWVSTSIQGWSSSHDHLPPGQRQLKGTLGSAIPEWSLLAWADLWWRWIKLE